jgi:hypothetical protein
MGFKEVLFGSKPKIETKTIVDPIKQSVASPLSRFLSEQPGQALPRFNPGTDTRGQILSDLPEGGGSSVSRFLSLDSEEFFNENIKNPAIETFQEELLPLIHEDFAGSLSGSGRLRAEGDAARGLARDLSRTRAELELTLPQAQFNIALQMKQEGDKEALLQYQDWLKSLPQANPALNQALQFLQDSTSSGTTVLSALNPGTQGILGDLIAITGAIASGGITTAVGAATKALARSSGSTTKAAGIGGSTPKATSFGGSSLNI